MSILVNIRTDYNVGDLKRTALDRDPLRQFQKWFKEIVKSGIKDPNAMTLASVDDKGRPSARTVLLKGIDPRGFSFFTNYQSRKGRQLSQNPAAALVFFWQPFARQVCVTGRVTKLSRKESEEYFHSRPRGSQMAAWASHQSEVIPDRNVLEQALAWAEKEFKGGPVPLPRYWGGFVLKPTTVEFWQGRPSRLHDRFRYSRKKSGGWRIERLSP